MVRNVLISGAIVCLALTGPVRAADDPTSIAVMEFASKGGIEAQKMDALSDMLANEIRALGNYKVVGKSDIRAALQLEEQKALLGCDDESCLAEIGGALGVRLVVTGNVSLFGKTYLLNLKMLDVADIKVVAGISQKVSGGEDMLIDALGVAAKKMIDRANETLGLTASKHKTTGDAKPGEKPLDDKASGVGAGLVVGENPPAGEVETSTGSKSRKTWGHVTFWTGTGALVLGLVGVAWAYAEARTYEDGSIESEQRIQALDRNSIGSGLGFAGLTIGAALMTTGLVLWFTGSDAPAQSVPAAGVAPTADGQGAVFGLSGRW